MLETKFCPDLIGIETVEPITIGSGSFSRPILRPCILHKCVAYKGGRCLKYNTEVNYSTEEEEDV